jgi:hypothetical protein
MRIKINPRDFVRAAAFAARFDIRYYLNGVHVEPAPNGLPGTIILGCDGNTLFAAHDPNGVFERAEGEPDNVVLRITPGLLASAKAAARANDRAVSVHRYVLLDGRRVSIAPNFGMESDDLETYVQPGDGRAVKDHSSGLDWRKVTPAFETLQPGNSAMVNPNYLARIAEVTPKAGRCATGVCFWQKPADPGGIMVVQFEAEPRYFALIMPMRGTGNSTCNWLLTSVRNAGATPT